MIVWAVANQKGGVGKTTSAVALAGLLAGQGNNTLLIDMDPHGSLTSYFKLDPDNLDRSTYQLFEQRAHGKALDPAGLIIASGFERLFLLPASTSMATVERRMGAANGMGLVLREALSVIRDQYDYVIIDCPPVLGVLLINAIAACNHLIVPVQTEFLALKGLERMISTITMVVRSLNKELSYTIVPTLYDRRTRAAIEALNVLRKQYAGPALWHESIPVDTLCRDASRAGIPISLYAPRARSTHAYTQLLVELMASQTAPSKSSVTL